MKANHKVKLSLVILLLLFIFGWWYIFAIDGASISSIFTERNLEFTKNFISNLFGVGNDQPAFLRAEAWQEALARTWDTIVMSILAVVMAMLGVVIFVIPTIRQVFTSKDQKPGALNKILSFVVKALFTFTRAVPELLWAILLIFIMQPGLLTGALALALNHFGILGKITTEQIENVDNRSFRNLKTTGASDFQVLIYGVIPSIMPKFLGSVFYRWEEIIRASVVVGFVGTGGLGQALQVSMAWRQFTTVLLYLICYFLAVNIIDIISGYAKRFVQNRRK